MNFFNFQSLINKAAALLNPLATEVVIFVDGELYAVKKITIAKNTCLIEADTK